VDRKQFHDNVVVIFVCLGLGIAAAGLYYTYTHNRSNRKGHHQHTVSFATKMLWRATIAVLCGTFAFLVFDTTHIPVFPSLTDFAISRMVYPFLGVSILLLLALQPCPSIIKNKILESPLFFLIGNASLPIYFVNLAIRDYYLPIITGTFNPAGPFAFADSNNDFRQALPRPTSYVILEAVIVLVVGCLVQKHLVDSILIPGAVTAWDWLISGCCCDDVSTDHDAANDHTTEGRRDEGGMAVVVNVV